MRDKLIEIIENGERKVLGHTIRGTSYYTEALADYLIANNVFVLPEKLKDSWELCSGFITRMLVANEEELEKIKKEFELQEVKKILTDIRDYLVGIMCDCLKRNDEPNFYEQNIVIYKQALKELAELTEYAEKLGVEL